LFAFLPGGQKLRFGSVQPSPAALIRAAFRLFKSASAQKEKRPSEWMGVFFFGAASQI